VVTHQKVREATWPHEADRRVDYLRIVIRNLRQKLEEDPGCPRLIINELGWVIGSSPKARTGPKPAAAMP
jgi:two-component system KDP operon response regulator KdpE